MEQDKDQSNPVDFAINNVSVTADSFEPLEVDIEISEEV